eukprot:CAMPEP_0176421006 /NCGR_PEP_ID=MMETSP0127-20121128/8928_1 /TAXON_ID=938130 /ORGANISM="Platyophrya macrostoma, Strain WH" /LENGTH=70 /DNA_ID=CAMNT_0017801677 /DNA_START=718 /DNA_END=927 /DNA_ORIENTATION=+
MVAGVPASPTILATEEESIVFRDVASSNSTGDGVRRTLSKPSTGTRLLNGPLVADCSSVGVECGHTPASD